MCSASDMSWNAPGKNQIDTIYAIFFDTPLSTKGGALLLLNECINQDTTEVVEQRGPCKFT